MLLIIGMHLIQHIATNIIRHIDLSSHPMWTIGIGYRQQQKHLLILLDPNDRLHKFLILHSEGILKGVELLIDKSIILEETLALKRVEDL